MLAESILFYQENNSCPSNFHLLGQCYMSSSYYKRAKGIDMGLA